MPAVSFSQVSFSMPTDTSNNKTSVIRPGLAALDSTVSVSTRPPR